MANKRKIALFAAGGLFALLILAVVDGKGCAKVRQKSAALSGNRKWIR